MVDARFCKPLDTDMLRRLAKEHPVMITVEEGSIGGFAAHVMQVSIAAAEVDGGNWTHASLFPHTFSAHKPARRFLHCRSSCVSRA